MTTSKPGRSDSTRAGRHLWRSILTAATCWLLLSSGLTAGDRFYSRYLKDQSTEMVLVEPSVGLSLVDGKVSLTEQQAIEMALRDNLGLNVERHRSIFTFWEVEDLQGAYDPQATFGFNWNRTTTPTGSVLQGGPSVTDILTGYDFGYSQAFSSGTSFEASFSGNRNRSTNFFSSLVPAINTNFQILLRQNLLKGFGKVVAEYQLEIARNNEDIAEEDFKRLVIDTILQVQLAYWELQFALEDIQVKEKSLELARTILEQNQARFEVGSAARLQVIEAEAEVATRLEEHIRTRFNYRRTQDQLVSLITNYADPREFQGEIVPAEPVIAPPAVADSFDHLLAVAGEQNPTLQRADLVVESQKVNLDQSRDQLKPTLDLVLGFQQFGLGGTRVDRDFSQGFVNPPIIGVFPGGLGDSLSQLFSGDFYGYTVGFNFQIPIFNKAARADNAQAQIELNRLQLQKQSLVQSVALGIRDALTQIEMNQARVDASQASVRLAMERLDGEQAKFEVGLGTTRELIEAQRDLVQSESILLRARVDLIASHAQLDQAVGRTLERRGVQIKDLLRTNVH